MKATEHRLGNLIYSPIQKEVVTLIAIEQGNRPITLGKMGTSSFSGFDCLEPIPLTEEWLLKFGFENCVNIRYYKKNIVVLDLEGNSFLKDKYNEEIAIEQTIKSVHQLQNLYFALTGEELKISREK